MVTLGNGATAQVRADIASMGSNLLTVMPGQRGGPGGASGSAKPFRRQDVEALTARCRRLRRRTGGDDDLSVISGAKNPPPRSPGRPTPISNRAAGSWRAAACSRERAALRRRGLHHRPDRRRTSCSERRSDRQPDPAALAILQRDRAAAIERQEQLRAGPGRYRGHPAADDAAALEREQDIQQVQLSVSSTDRPKRRSRTSLA